MFLAQFNIKAQEPKVVLITIDGLRWKEIFRGADSYLINNNDFTSSKNIYLEKFFVKDSIKRRELLMPFTWKVIKEKGIMLGNRDEGNLVNLINKRLWSYPGYNEIITGSPDDANIINNDDINNPNVSIFEYINQQNGFKGEVAILGSWSGEDLRIEDWHN